MRDIVHEIKTEWERRLGSERFAELRLLLTDLNRQIAADEATDQRRLSHDDTAIVDENVKARHPGDLR